MIWIGDFKIIKRGIAAITDNNIILIKWLLIQTSGKIGQDPTEILKQTPKPYGLLKVLSALLHILIHIRIQFYKQKDSLRKQQYIQEVESR